MAARGSKLSRAVGFFREADQDEAEAAFIIVQRVMQQRNPSQPPAQKPKVARKPRRTKAQMAADRNQLGTQAVASA